MGLIRWIDIGCTVRVCASHVHYTHRCEHRLIVFCGYSKTAGMKRCDVMYHRRSRSNKVQEQEENERGEEGGEGVGEIGVRGDVRKEGERREGGVMKDVFESVSARCDEKVC